MGKRDNTLIIYISGDNGGSAEGTLVVGVQHPFLLDQAGRVALRRHAPPARELSTGRQHPG